MSTNAIIAALAAACALGATGCEATFTPAEPVYAYADGAIVAPVAAVPADIGAYPRIYYGGTYVYLVNGSWYEPTRSGWVVFRREPVVLARERARIYASPRVRPSPAYGYPAPRPAPPVQEPYEYNRERTPNP